MVLTGCRGDPTTDFADPVNATRRFSYRYGMADSDPLGHNGQDAVREPTSSRRANRMPSVIGVFVAGFSTTVFPAAIAGASARTESFSGKFHGEILSPRPAVHARRCLVTGDVRDGVFARHPPRHGRSLGDLVGCEVDDVSSLAGPVRPRLQGGDNASRPFDAGAGRCRSSRCAGGVCLHSS